MPDLDTEPTLVADLEDTGQERVDISTVIGFVAEFNANVQLFQELATPLLLQNSVDIPVLFAAHNYQQRAIVDLRSKVNLLDTLVDRLRAARYGYSPSSSGSNLTLD